MDDAELAAAGVAQERRLAAAPAHAALECRALLDAAVANDLPAQLEHEAERQRVLIDGAAFSEGVRAFAEPRDPMFPPRGA